MLTFRPLAGPAALVLLLVLTSCGKPPQMGAGPGGNKMPPAEVGVMTVQSQTVALNTVLSGRTSPYAVAEIRPQVTGIIQQRLFTEGGEVRAGMPLYQIDAASYQASLEAAKAALARSEANLQTVRLKSERYAALLGEKAVSQQEADDAQAAFKQAEASVAADKAAIEIARINLGYTRVMAPISGVIGKSAVTQGALVTANQAMALASVQQLDPIYVDVTQSNSDLLRLKRELASGALKRAGNNEAAVTLLLEDGSPYPLPGKLAFTDVSVDAGSGSVTLRAVFPNPKRDLLPGMFVRAQLQTGARDDSIVVPQQAVSRNTRGDATVMVVGADGKFEPRVIRAEQAIGDKWLVTSGLKAGEQIIVEGLQKLRPGVTIQPVPAGSTGKPPASGGAAGANGKG
jgi:membrane fusion protein (multidrug efflux system)